MFELLLVRRSGLPRLTELGAISSPEKGVRSLTLKNELPLWLSRATKVELSSWISAAALVGPTSRAPWPTKKPGQQADPRPREVTLKLLRLVATNNGPPRVSVLGALAVAERRRVRISPAVSTSEASKASRGPAPVVRTVEPSPMNRKV